MSDPQPETRKTAVTPDPWREMRDAYMATWAKALGETVNSEAYSMASGATLETFLNTSAPFRDVQKKMMVSALEQLNMPSRADFVSLAERLANLELLLDDMAARLNQIHLLAIKAAVQPAIAAKPEPPIVESEAQKAEAPKVELGSSELEPVTKSSSSKTTTTIAKKRSK